MHDQGSEEQDPEERPLDHILRTGTVPDSILRTIVDRIVREIHPEKIILFGSAARGEMGRDSDVDVLVVKAGVDRVQAAQRLYRALRGLGVPKDIIVLTPEDVERRKHLPGTMVGPALREGRVLYAA